MRSKNELCFHKPFTLFSFQLLNNQFLNVSSLLFVLLQLTGILPVWFQHSFLKTLLVLFLLF